MANFLALYGERLDRELGTADRTSLFTTARRKDAINQGQLEFAKQTNCYVKWIDLTLTDDTAEVDLDATSAIADGDFLDFSTEPAEYVYTDSAGVVTSVSGDDNFPRRDITDLNRHEPGWRNADAAQLPTSWYVRENGGSTLIGLYPPPSITAGDTAVLRVPYVAMPPEMSSDDDLPFMTSGGDAKVRLTPWHQALVHYAAALLEPLRKGRAAAQEQRALFSAFVADYLSKQRRKGGQKLTIARNYYQDTRRRASFTGGERIDPLRYP